MAMTPNQSVIWYQKRFTPNNRNMNRFSDAIPTSDPFGPIGFTSTFAATTVKAANSKNKAPVKINFFCFLYSWFILFSLCIVFADCSCIIVSFHRKGQETSRHNGKKPLILFVSRAFSLYYSLFHTTFFDQKNNLYHKQHK